MANLDLKLAAAVKYTKERQAPVLLEKGRGRTAHRMLETARESGIPVRQDDIVSYLMEVEKSAEIDEDLFDVLAGIYAEIINIDMLSI